MVDSKIIDFTTGKPQSEPLDLGEKSTGVIHVDFVSKKVKTTPPSGEKPWLSKTAIICREISVRLGNRHPVIAKWLWPDNDGDDDGLNN